MATIEQLAERANINRKKLADLRRMFGDIGVQHLLSNTKETGKVSQELYDLIVSELGDKIAQRFLKMVHDSKPNQTAVVSENQGIGKRSIWFTHASKEYPYQDTHFWEQFTTKDHS